MRTLRLLAGAATVAALAVLTASCSAASPARPQAVKIRHGGTATVAFLEGTGPNWIFPFASEALASATNTQDFSNLMYRPLYLFGGDNNSVTVNYPISMADRPVYAGSGRTVSITLKDWKWSDGEPVDAADVIFWLNMDEAEKADFAGYVSGELPDNLLSYRAAGPRTVVIRLASAYSRTWFTYNELSQITPMPAAWDITRTGARPGTGGCEHDTALDHWARCAAVFDYLTKMARDYGSYTAAGSVWSVVDGPWRLRAFSFGRDASFVPNQAYSGVPKPALGALRYVSYSSQAAIYKSVRSGQVDVATIPSADLLARSGSSAPRASSRLAGYTLQPAYVFGISYLVLDYRDQQVGQLLRQMYFRQALQELIDQPAIILSAYDGYAVPTLAAVPSLSRSPWSLSTMTANHGAGPYPYEPAKAEALLSAHGWSVVGGTLTCERAGPAADECGPGIRVGEAARLNVVDLAATEGAAVLTAVSTEFRRAGIRLSWYHSDVPFFSSGPYPCRSNCEVAMQYFGGWSFTGPGSPGYLPSGEMLFQAGGNYGEYSSPQMNALIQAVQHNNSVGALRAYVNFTAIQVPDIWLPMWYSIVAVSDKLHRVTPSPLGSFYPEYWYLS